jgi:hypothetical protein
LVSTVGDGRWYLRRSFDGAAFMLNAEGVMARGLGRRSPVGNYKKLVVDTKATRARCS